MPSRECLDDHPPIKTLDSESLMSFLVRQISHELSQLVAVGMKCIPRGSAGVLWSLPLVSSGLHPCTFSSADLALCATIVGSHSCEYFRIPVPMPVTHARELSYLKVVFRALSTPPLS